MTPLDVALDRLIHKRSYRTAFVERRIADLDLAPEILDALGGIDLGTLAALAERIASDLLSRRHAGSGSLVELFPLTVAAYDLRHPEDPRTELAFAFMDSPAFESYREIPFAGLGCTLEEAFYRFCEQENVGHPAEREAEFLAATARLLAVNPRVAATIPREFRPTPHGYSAVSTRGTPTLFAAVRGRFVTGRLTPFLADLATGTDSAATARRHRVPSAVLDESLRRFSELGIL